jgi:hypothetical protein
MDENSRTPPPKPQGILLTPGTGTSRPKRVSFGREVKGNKHGVTSAAPVGEKVKDKKEDENHQQKDNPSTSDDDWEEEDEGDDPENYCNHDLTIDLNEPHSQSGRYWKEQYVKYHDEAQVEMGKLLKYKQLAKSYAQQKDAEAIDLAEKLKEQQHKVIKMEKKIAENASQIMTQTQGSTEGASPDLIKKLTKQTALAVQYRQRVADLENQLEDVLEDRNEGAESKGRRRVPATSPRTHKTLLETQRELRKARNQTKELTTLRQQVSELKGQLKEAEKRAIKSEAMSSSGGDQNARAKDLRAQLRSAQEEAKLKDELIQQLTKEFDAFRQERQAHEEDMRAVLERTHSKIAELKKENKTLKGFAQGRSVREIGSNSRSENEENEENGREDNAEPDVKDDVPKTSQTEGRSQNLREKFRQGAVGSESSERIRTTTMSGALRGRPSLEKPKWQPFVPRSPRNRAYLGEDVANKIQNGGITPMAARPGKIVAPDLQDLAKSISRSDRPPSSLTAEAKVDLLSDRFARLGGPDFSTQPYMVETNRSDKASNSRLPPERRAAAMARIAQRRAEKESQRQNVMDKENVRPC